MVLEMINCSPAENKIQDASRSGKANNESEYRKSDTFKRWQIAFKLAETYSFLNQDKPSFETKFRVDQACEQFLSLSEDYIVHGLTMARFPGAPVVPRDTQHHLDKLGQILDGPIKTHPGELQDQRRKVLDTLLDPERTDPDIGILLPDNLSEKCERLEISTKDAIEIIDQFNSLRKQVTEHLIRDRNHLKMHVSELWDHLAEGATEETQRAQERADKRARFSNLTDDGRQDEPLNYASSSEAVLYEKREGSSWHTVESDSDASLPYYKASPEPSISRLGFSQNNTTDEALGSEKSSKKQSALSKAFRRELEHLEKKFNELEGDHQTKHIDSWRNMIADPELRASSARTGTQRLKRSASESEHSESDYREPASKRHKLDCRERTPTTSR
jgi:hypothetical protein